MRNIVQILHFQHLPLQLARMRQCMKPMLLNAITHLWRHLCRHLCRIFTLNKFLFICPHDYRLIQVKPVWHRTRLGTRFQYGILGYTRVGWYEYLAPTVPGDELVRFKLECSMDILDQARFVTVWTRFAKRFSYDCLRFQVRSNTVCYGPVRLDTTFTQLTGHLQGLHTCTVPPTFVRVRFHTIYIRYWHGWAHSLSGLHVRLYIRSHTVSHGLVRSLIRLYTNMAPVSVF